MKLPRLIISGLILVALLLISWFHLEPSPQPGGAASSASAPTKIAPAIATASAPVSTPIEAMTDLPAAISDPISAFQAWTARYLTAVGAEKDNLLAEGLHLARARRPVFKQLIQNDPRRALELAVPMVVRQQLPEDILALLERRLHTRADVEVQAVSDDSGPEEPVIRWFTHAGEETFRTHVYGRRTGQNSLFDVPVHGVAIDLQLALHESPLRRLETGEIPPPELVRVQACPISGIVTPVDEPPPPVTEATPAVQVADTIVYVCDGGHIRLYEAELIAAEGGTGGATPLTAPAATSFNNGPRRLLYMRLTFPDDLQEPQSEVQAWDAIRQLNSYFTEISFGKIFYLCDVTPAILLPRSRAWYTADYAATGNNNPIMNDAKDAARALGYNPDNYDHWTVIYTGGTGNGPGTFGGLGSVGGRNVWLRTTSVGTFAHEIGHNVGLWHANSWDSNRNASGSWDTTQANSVIGGGRNGEYGHLYDVLGSSGSFTGNKGHFIGHHKNLMNWLPNESVSTATVSGLYRIFPMDQTILDPARRYGLRITKDATRDYWLDFRQKYNDDHRWFRDGVLLHWTRWGQNLDVSIAGSNRGGQLLDTTPGSADGKNDAPIVIGRTFSDRESHIHITPIAKGGTTPESIDIQVHLGPFPTNQPPVIHSLTASTTSPAVNGTVHFNVDATDPDGDPLAFFWDFGDATYPENNLNAPAVSKTFTSARHHAVRCIVSDMKGGETSRLILITVGAPSSFTVSGRILDADANPVPDVRVHNGGTGTGFRGGWTDSNGDFIVTHLASGSVTLTPIKEGLLFTPANRTLALGPSASNADFAAASSVLVSVSAPDPEAAETGGNSGLFRLTRTGPVTTALTVHADLQGDATLSTDYTLSPAPNTTSLSPIETFTIPAGQDTLDIVLTALNDTLREGPENARLILIPANAYTISGPAAADITILDTGANSVPNRVSILALDEDASEDGDPALFEIRRTGPTASPLTVHFTLDAPPNTTPASNGLDFQTITSPIVIPAGQTAVQIPVLPLQDTAVEGQETLRLTLAANTAYGVGSPASAVVRIADDDTPTVTLIASDPTASEAGLDTGAFTVTRTGDTSQPLEVAYTIAGSALHGTDYLPLPGTLTIPAGAASAEILIIPIDDDLGEPTQTVILQLRNDPRYLLGTPHTATVNILDNDLPVVAIGVSNALCREPSGNGAFRLTTTGSGSGNITVKYAVSGTATPGTDFQNLPGTLTMGRNTSATLTITPIDDLIPEDAESVIITLLPDPTYQIDVLQPQASLLIRDNDHPQSVSVSFSPVTMPENGSSKLFISRVNPDKTAATSGNLTVHYALSGTATPDVDYAGLSGTAIIPNGSSNVSIDVTAIDDSLSEGTESVIVTLLPGSYSREVASTTLLILDNETSGFTRTAAFASRRTVKTEGDAPFSLPVVLSSPDPVNPVTVEFSLDTNSATGSGVDFLLPATATLTFPPGATEQTIPVTVIDDLLPEPDEHFTLRLTHATGAQLQPEGAYHTVFIRDNEPRVTLAASRPTAYESNATQGRLTLSRSGPVQAALSVALAYSGTATPGVDYTALPTTATFSAGQRHLHLHVTPVPDALNEGPETVIATLQPSSRYLIVNPTATVTILDSGPNHPPSIQITQPTSSEVGLPQDTALHLAAHVSDDGPPASWTLSWTRVSGPGSASFADPGAAQTTVTFTSPGHHLLRCTATDSASLSTHADLSVLVSPAANAWTTQDIGITSPNATGTADLRESWLQNQGTGLSLTSTSDSFHFAHAELQGDGDLIARYEATDGFFSTARTGLMLRESTAPNARSLSLTFNGNSGSLSFNRRTATGGTVSTTAVSLPPGPRWLRLSRAGNSFSAWHSLDGSAWTQLGTSQALTLPTSLRAGIATTSANTARPARGLFSQLHLSGLPQNTAPRVQAASATSLNAAHSIALNGLIEDDGIPSLNSPPAALWSQVSGPGSTTFSAPSSPATLASFDAEGAYLLRLSADDGGAASCHDITVQVTFASLAHAGVQHAHEAGLIPGHFLLTRSGPTDQPLTVSCASTGTATPGLDFHPLPSQLTFPAGSASLTLPLIPVADTLAEGDETVTLTLLSGNGYHLPSPASATALIHDLPIDAWRFSHFGPDANTPAIADLLADPDFDGLPNLLEFALHTLPLQPNPSPLQASTTTVDGQHYLHLTLPKNPQAAFLVFTVEATSDPGNAASWSSAGLVIEQNTATLLRVRDHVPLSPGIRRFMRARVSLPPDD